MEWRYATRSLLSSLPADLLQHNPYSSASSHGSDFAAVFAHPALDFASIHLYPDQWCPPATPRAELK